MYPKLIEISGANIGREHYLAPRKELSIGRKPGNNIVIADPLVSRTDHCRVWNDGELVNLRNINGPKGTWVNDRYILNGVLGQSDHLEFGGTTLLVALQELTGNALPAMINDEVDRQRCMETLVGDYTVRTEEAIRRKEVTDVLLRMIDSLKAVTNLELLKKTLLEMALQITPAVRAAFLINGPRVSPDIHDFAQALYIRKGFKGPTPFKLSTAVLTSVYETKLPKVTKDLTPVICVPFAPAGAMQGVIYLEGRPSDNQFEREHQDYLTSIATIAETAVRLNGEIQEIKDTRDFYKQQVEEEALIIGESPQIHQVLNDMKIAATADVAVLITGETGTGKELVACGIHMMSRRANGKLAKINCSAIPSALFESEVYGHEKGSFTGAVGQKIGKLENANRGTFFMDEVGDLSLELQPKFLSALESKTFERVGGIETIKVDVRLIAATSLDLKKLVDEGKFRRDLMYRLNVFPIHLPPLRERRSDIPLLINHYLKKLGAPRGFESVEPKAMQHLMDYAWPGNIREVRNLIEWAVLKCQPPVMRWEILQKHLELAGISANSASVPLVGEKLHEVAAYAAKQARKALAEKVIAKHNGDKVAAAEELGCEVQYLYKILKTK